MRQTTREDLCMDEPQGMLIDPERMGWLLCPNEPQCAHLAGIHTSPDDGSPECCVTGCQCGAGHAVRGDRPTARE